MLRKEDWAAEVKDSLGRALDEAKRIQRIDPDDTKALLELDEALPLDVFNERTNEEAPEPSQAKSSETRGRKPRRGNPSSVVLGVRMTPAERTLLEVVSQGSAARFIREAMMAKIEEMLEQEPNSALLHAYQEYMDE